jgi:tRNA(Ile)-lysidine synthase
VERESRSPEPVIRIRDALTSVDGVFPGVVVAVSGGADSTALLRATLQARGEQRSPLIVAHLNHQLRGADSDGDEAFVVALHGRLVEQGAQALHLVCARRDLHAEADGANLESTARRVRYGWLAQVAHAQGVGLVATGHTASDQAETVLHHLLRGTGMAGLRGIAARRELEPGVEVVRPLLSATRETLLAYLTTLGQDHREDDSNRDRRFTRNRLRNELLPLLRAEYNPRLDVVLAHLAEQADEVYREEDRQCRELLGRVELPRAGSLVILDAVALAALGDRLACGVLRLVWARERWSMAEMGYDDWRRAVRLVHGEGSVDLPGRVHARRRGRVLQIGPSAFR